MPYTIPNEAAAGFADQAEPDQVDFDIITAGLSHGTGGTGFGTGPTGVQSGCAVTAQGTPDMTVAVAAGIVRIGGRRVTVAGGNVAITAASGSNPRFDLIVVDTAGTKTAIAGTAATNPIFPSITTGKVVLASVYVPTSDTAINTNQITDKRVMIPNPPHEDVTWYGATGDGSTDDGTAFADCYLAASGTLALDGKVPRIYVPEGRFKLDSTGGWVFDNQKPVHVIGHNPRRTWSTTGNTTWSATGSVLFRSGSNYTDVANPTVPVVAALAGAAGVVDPGDHCYKWTYVTAAGESDPSLASNVVTTSAGNGQITITAPLGPTGTTSRKLYRSKAGNLHAWFLQQTLGDNTTTNFVQDNTTDALLGAALPFGAMRKRAIISYGTAQPANIGSGFIFENLIFELQDPTGGSAIAGMTVAINNYCVNHTVIKQCACFSKNLWGVFILNENTTDNARDASWGRAERNFCQGAAFFRTYEQGHNCDGWLIERNTFWASDPPLDGVFMDRPTRCMIRDNDVGWPSVTYTVWGIRIGSGRGLFIDGNGGENTNNFCLIDNGSIGGSSSCFVNNLGRISSQLSTDILLKFDGYTTGGNFAFMPLVGAYPAASTPYVDNTTGKVNTALGGTAPSIGDNRDVMWLTHIKRGSGSPEGVVTGRVGDVWQQKDSSIAANCLWVKATGDNTNTGWRTLLFGTRTIYCDGSVLRLDAATGIRLGSPPNAIDGVQLADGVTSGAYFNFPMPPDAITQTITVRPVWAPGSTDGTAHTVRWQMQIKILTGADVTAASTAVAWTGDSAARTANVQVVETGQASTAVTPAANDNVRLEVQRIGADANDTYVGAVNLIGVRVDYGSYS